MRRVIVRRRPKPSLKRLMPVASPAGNVKILDKETLDRFSPAILGLGDISVPAREIEAMAAIFDLAGFTRFCNQVDQHLTVPKFLSSFLDWLFDIIKTRLTAGNYDGRKAMWAELPFLAKFMGDGLLLLWNTKGMSEPLICRVITTLYDICYVYKHQFYPEMRMVVDKPPATLRCGAARGRVFSVGNGRDYIGHCINTASRLQKLSLLTFCFPQRGFNIQEHMKEDYRRLFVKKSVSVRGVGENELVWVLEEEFNKLPEKLKAPFQDP